MTRGLVRRRGSAPICPWLAAAPVLTALACATAQGGGSGFSAPAEDAKGASDHAVQGGLQNDAIMLPPTSGFSGLEIADAIPLCPYDAVRGTSSAEIERALHDRALRHHVVAERCAEVDPIRQAVIDGTGIRVPKPTTDFGRVAACATGMLGIGELWIPSVVDRFDICAMVLGSTWRLPTEGDLSALGGQDLTPLVPTEGPQPISRLRDEPPIASAMRAAAGDTRPAAQRDLLPVAATDAFGAPTRYSSLLVYVRSVRGELMYADLLAGGPARLFAIPQNYRANPFPGASLRCVRDVDTPAPPPIPPTGAAMRCLDERAAAAKALWSARLQYQRNPPKPPSLKCEPPGNIDPRCGAYCPPGTSFNVRTGCVQKAAFVEALAPYCQGDVSPACWDLAQAEREAGGSHAASAGQLYRRLCAKEWRRVCEEETPDLSNDGLRCCDAMEPLVFGRAPPLAAMQLEECRKRAKAGERLSRVREPLKALLKGVFPRECTEPAPP